MRVVIPVALIRFASAQRSVLPSFYEGGWRLFSFGFVFLCVHFVYLMNGRNHLDESDRTPLFLCPVCLRKLRSANPFPIRERDRRLEDFSEEAGPENEACWARLRLEELGR